MDAALTIQHNATRADPEALPAHLRGEPFDATPLDVLGWWEALDAVP